MDKQHLLSLSLGTHLALTDASFRFKTLSGTGLTGPDGADVRSPLTQPRRLALLAYLAIERPGGFHRRDQLLVLFWPELDTGRARAALSQALYVLRQSLGEETLPSRGAEELGVDSARLWCDAAECDRLLQSGALEQALELYSGDLLPGFHVAEAPEFDRWLESTRDDLRRRAAEAATSLSAGAEAAGEYGAAVRWARRAVQLAPFDEPTLRKLLLVCERAGDRGSAMLAYQEFVDRLHAELELAPSPATIALADRLRNRPIDSPPAVDAVEPRRSENVETSPVADEAAVEATATAAPIARRSVRARAAIAATAAAMLVLGAFGMRAMQTDESAVDRVVVLPFVVHGDSGLGYLREGMVDLLSTRLDGLGSLRAIDPTAVLAQDGLETMSGPALAAEFGATLYAEGSITPLGRALDVRMTLHEADGTAFTTVVGRAADQNGLGPLVDSLASALFASRLRSPEDRLTSEAMRSTASGAALRAYLEGEHHFRRGEYPLAVDAYSRATVQDSLFALAWYRLSVAAGWAAPQELLQHAADRAKALAHRLSPRDRRLLEAYDAWHGRAARSSDAERYYRALTLDYPDDAEAWYWLGEVLYHANPQRGRPIAESEGPFQRAAALVSNGHDAAGHLLFLRAMSGDRVALDSALSDRLQRLSSGAARREVFFLLDRALRDTDAAWRDMLDSLRTAPAATISLATMVAGRFEGTIARADDLARLLHASARARHERIQGFALSASIRVAQGRWRDAQVAVDELQRLDASAAHEVRGYLAALPWLPLSPDERQAVRRELAAWPAVKAVEPVGSPGTGLTQSLLREFYLSTLSSLSGDTLTGTAAVEAMVSEGASPPDLRVIRTSQALTSLLRNDAAAALRALGPSPDSLLRAAVVDGFGFSNAYERWLRAEALEASGRRDEALAWYQTFESWSMNDMMWLAPSLLRRGRLHEMAGQRDSARVAYTRALDLWSGSDSRFAAEVNRIRTRLAGLQTLR
ncbi:MAG: BTAD domain-containing putative transcriptional regulator [Gemmatimonadaceae bacterium]